MTCLRCGGIFNDEFVSKFTATSEGEEIDKIGEVFGVTHLVWLTLGTGPVLTRHPVDGDNMHEIRDSWPSHRDSTCVDDTWQRSRDRCW